SAQSNKGRETGLFAFQGSPQTDGLTPSPSSSPTPTATNNGARDGTILSDATPDNDWRPGAQYANRGRGRGSRGGWDEGTPGQQARFEVLNTEHGQLVRRIQERDPQWRPRP